MRLPYLSTVCLLLGVLGSACRGAAQGGPPAASPDGLLAPERIATLPAAEREAWASYLDRSRRLRAADRAALEAELRALGRAQSLAAPRGTSLLVDDRTMTAEWLRGEEARRIAEAILSFQTRSGGWSKRLDLSRPREPGMSFSAEGSGYVATFDNDATTEQLRFLLRIRRLAPDPRYERALRRGIDFVHAAQFPNGCWPQVFPLQGGYHDAATLNDDATANILRLLREVAADSALPAATRTRARDAVERGIDCLLRSQVVVDGAPTLWAAQHDPLTLRPVGARSYEHPSLSGRESVPVLLLLMDLEDPDDRVIRAVQGAVAWLREHAIYGLDYEAKGELRERPGAGPLWARFYELGSNRPIFSNRDGVVRYSWQELEDERRYGYGWYTDEPARVLRRYERWARRHRLTTPPATPR